MARGRRPHPDQYAVVPGGDPREHARKSEERSEVLATTIAQVEAYCDARSIDAPTITEWRNAQEVLTYMIHVRTDRGIYPRIETIAQRAWPEP